MKFAEHLSSHLTPEWRSQYLDYENLKDLLYDSVDKIEYLPNDDSIISHINECDNVFFEECTKELDKINNFYSEKKSEAKSRINKLRYELKQKLFIGTQIPIKLNDIKHIDESNDGTDKELEKKLSDGSIHSVGRLRNWKKPKTVTKKHIKSLYDFKLAYSEFYLSLVLLQNYQALNYTGFRKILKKHDKLFHRSTGAKWMKDNIEDSDFHSCSAVEDMIKEIEDTFTDKFEHGNRSKAMKRLRVPPLYEKPAPVTCFKFGCFLGTFSILMSVIFLTYLFNPNVPNLYKMSFLAFRGTFLLYLFFGFIGVNTYGWRANGVNHVLIFEIDPRNHLIFIDFLYISSILLTIWSITVLMFLYHYYLGISPYWGPLANVTFGLIFLLQPLGFYRAKKWLVLILWRVIRAPFVSVGFADFWVADQLNSLAFLFKDSGRLICYYSCGLDWPLLNINSTHFNSTIDSFTQTQSNNTLAYRELHCDNLIYGILPLLSILPAWFRFAQCIRRYIDMPKKRPFPHLVNAGKYFTSFLVEFSAVYAKLYDFNATSISICVIFSIIKTVYCLYWDFFNDWGLIDYKNRENYLLRDQLVYHYKAYYYMAIIEDFIIRFDWVLILWAKIVNHKHLMIIETAGITLEVFRRFVWNFFRLENEHLNNCGQFRAVRDISVAPIPKQSPLAKKSLFNLRTENKNKTKTDKSPNKRNSCHLLKIDIENTSENQNSAPISNTETFPYTGMKTVPFDADSFKFTISNIDESGATNKVPSVIEIEYDYFKQEEEEEDSHNITIMPDKTKRFAEQLHKILRRSESGSGKHSHETINEAASSSDLPKFVLNSPKKTNDHKDSLFIDKPNEQSTHNKNKQIKDNEILKKKDEIKHVVVQRSAGNKIFTITRHIEDD